MTRLEWNSVGNRFYESGIDRGVLFVGSSPGVAWSGLTSVSLNPSGGDPTPYYLDGIKYANTPSSEEYRATISAFTYPEEFEQCDGFAQPRPGMYFSQQRRKEFGFSYRTKIGNDQTDGHGYKIHIVYNVLANPSKRSFETHEEDVDPIDFSWDISVRPPSLSGYKRTSHVVIDSTSTDPVILGSIEDILYGSDSTTSRLPSIEELFTIFDSSTTLTVTDNGDGTYTVDAPAGVIKMLDESTFEITWSTAIFIDADSYTISS